MDQKYDRDHVLGHVHPQSDGSVAHVQDRERVADLRSLFCHVDLRWVWPEAIEAAPVPLTMRRHTLRVCCGHGNSLGNMIERAGGAGPYDGTLDVEERESGVFYVVGDTITGVSRPDLGFAAWYDDVEDLDMQSDAAQCFGMSELLRWQDVFLCPREFRGPSVERIQAALDRITVCAWDPADI